ncbi:MAG: hypothetical protein M3Z32_11600 [Acidobacteriota bacterium]|nr:hypothetical protein [Acidobacteriota bacterium]
MRLAFALALGLGVCAGEPPTTSLPVKGKTMHSGVTEAQVQRWLKSWQRRLSLDDWQISAHIVRSRDLKPDTLGNLRWNSADKTATIRVMDAFDYDLPAPEIETDMEYTVVHELLHLQLAVLPRGPGTKEVEERVVNRIGEALFSLEKGSHYRPRQALANISAKGRSASEASRSAK